MRTPTTSELHQLDNVYRDRPDFAPPTATPAEVEWRHSGWQSRRDKLRLALAAVSTTRGRLERWDNCGACAVVEWSPARQRHRVTCWHCRDRWCQACQVAKRCELVRIVDGEKPQEKLRFLTFTLRHDDSALRPKVAQLKAAFRRLTRSRWWKARVVGGVAVLEVKMSEKGRWHPHLHCIVDAAWMDKGELSDAWRIASKGSFVADVRIVTNEKHAAGYIGKYVTKGVDASVLNNPAALAEAIAALRGSRTFDVFGSWRGRRGDVEPDGDCCTDHEVNDWKPVATVREWLTALNAKQPWADAIRTSLLARNTKRQDGS